MDEQIEDEFMRACSALNISEAQSGALSPKTPKRKANLNVNNLRMFQRHDSATPLVYVNDLNKTSRLDYLAKREQE